MSKVASAGYPNLEQALNTVVRSVKIIDQKCFEDAQWSTWVNSDIISELKCSTKIEFNVLGKAPRWVPSEKNGPRVFQTMEVGKICAQMCPSNELPVKINKEDIDDTCGKAMTVLEMGIENSIKQLKEDYAKQVIARYLTEGASYNRGDTSGFAGFATRNIPIGSQAAPQSIVPTAASVTKALSNIELVAKQTKCYKGGWKLLVPPEFSSIVSRAGLSEALTKFGDCMDCAGRMEGNAEYTLPGFNFRVTETQLLPVSVIGGILSGPMIAFHPDAMGFRGGIYDALTDTELDDLRFVLKETSGGVMIHPQMVVVGYYSFQI